MTIGEKIKSRRIELGLTLEQVGNSVGVGKSTVRKWETGDIKNMRRDKIAVLSSVLRMSPNEFIDYNSIGNISFEAEDLGVLSGRLRYLREASNFSVEWLATQIGIAPDLIESFEATATDISSEVLSRYCYYFNVSADWLIGLRLDEYPVSSEKILLIAYRNANAQAKEDAIALLESHPRKEEYHPSSESDYDVLAKAARAAATRADENEKRSTGS